MIICLVVAKNSPKRKMEEMVKEDSILSVGLHYLPDNPEGILVSDRRERAT